MSKAKTSYVPTCFDPISVESNNFKTMMGTDFCWLQNILFLGTSKISRKNFTIFFLLKSQASVSLTHLCAYAAIENSVEVTKVRQISFWLKWVALKRAGW